MTRNQSCILRALLFVFFIIRFLTGPVSAESLAHIVRKSEAVVQAHVSQISRYVDEHNAPVDIVTLQVTEVIIGEILNNTITLSMKVGVIYNGPPMPQFEQDEKVILCLIKVQGDWHVLGNSLGKFTITGTTIEGSAISIEQFKSRIREVAASTSAHIDWPPGHIGNHGSASGDVKLNSEFSLVNSSYCPNC